MKEDDEVMICHHVRESRIGRIIGEREASFDGPSVDSWVVTSDYFDDHICFNKHSSDGKHFNENRAYWIEELEYFCENLTCIFHIRIQGQKDFMEAKVRHHDGTEIRQRKRFLTRTIDHRGKASQVETYLCSTCTAAIDAATSKMKGAIA